MSENKNIKRFVIVALIVVIAMIVAIILLLSGVFNVSGSKVSTTEPLKEIGGTNIIDNTNNTNTSNTNTTQNTVANQTSTGKVDLASGDFTTQFIKLENNSKNIIYSPLSIQYALHMLSEGAKGNTKSQIDNIVGTHKLTSYKNIDKVLSLANGLFIRDSYQNKVLNSYKNVLQDSYNADINYDPFNNANNVNKWINDKTFGIIPKLLLDEQVTDPMLKLIIVNALAIDMEWKIPFSIDSIHQKDFTGQYGDKTPVAMMSNESSSESISYYKGDNVTALGMDLLEYEGNQFQFVAIMPDKDLNAYIKDFSYSDVQEVVDNLKLASKEKDGVIYRIPKFNYEYDLKLKSDLMQMGIKDAFDAGAANFENIIGQVTDEYRLYVSDALHKAKIDFTHKGVKAAAVTALLMKENAMAIMEEKHPVEVTIDKPFLYVIRDKKTNEIWFVGATFEPMKWEDYQKELEAGSKSLDNIGLVN